MWSHVLRDLSNSRESPTKTHPVLAPCPERITGRVYRDPPSDARSLTGDRFAEGSAYGTL